MIAGAATSLRRGVIRSAARAMVMAALIMLSLAVGRSIVMQAADAAPGAAGILCTAAGLTRATLDHGAPLHGKRPACPFCAVASHTPTDAAISPLPQASAIAWIAYPATPTNGARGPPILEPKARGPPTVLPTT